MIAAILLIAIKGTMDVGGITNVIQRNLESGRIEPPKYVNKTFSNNSVHFGVVSQFGRQPIGQAYSVVSDDWWIRLRLASRSCQSKHGAKISSPAYFVCS